MEIRLIALDLDGTLLTGDKKLSGRNRKALEDCIEKGIEIVPCTGRTLEGIPAFIREIQGLRYGILTNGARIANLKTGEILSVSPLGWETGLRIMDSIRGIRLFYDAYINGRGKANRELLENLEEFRFSPEGAALIRSTRDPVPDLRAYLEKEKPLIDKINLYFKEAETRSRMREILGREKGILMTSSMPNNLEINGEEASKGNGIRFLAHYLGIPVSQTMAFGDGENDKSMMECGSVGVAMENGHPLLKKMAKYIAPANDADGVAQVVEELIL